MQVSLRHDPGECSPINWIIDPARFPAAPLQPTENRPWKPATDNPSVKTRHWKPATGNPPMGNLTHQPSSESLAHAVTASPPVFADNISSAKVLSRPSPIAPPAYLNHFFWPESLRPQYNRKPTPFASSFQGHKAILAAFSERSCPQGFISSVFTLR